MVSDNGPTYLVTGATRGIGRELVKQLSKDADATVIAGVRDPNGHLSKTLQIDFPNVVIVKIDSEVDSDPSEAVKKLLSLDINKVDTIFANAAILLDAEEAVNVRPENLRQLFNVNTVAPLILFQAFKPLLEASKNPSKFVLFSSSIGSISAQFKSSYNATSYGASKAALNFIMVRLALENKGIISFAIHPGMVITEMASFAMKAINQTLDNVLKTGMAITAEQSVNAIIKTAKEATLETTSGQYLNVTNGQVIPW